VQVNIMPHRAEEEQILTILVLANQIEHLFHTQCMLKEI